MVNGKYDCKEIVKRERERDNKADIKGKYQKIDDIDEYVRLDKNCRPWKYLKNFQIVFF